MWHLVEDMSADAQQYWQAFDRHNMSAEPEASEGLVQLQGSASNGLRGSGSRELPISAEASEQAIRAELDLQLGNRLGGCARCEQHFREIWQELRSLKIRV